MAITHPVAIEAINKNNPKSILNDCVVYGHSIGWQVDRTDCNGPQSESRRTVMWRN